LANAQFTINGFTPPFYTSHNTVLTFQLLEVKNIKSIAWTVIGYWNGPNNAPAAITRSGVPLGVTASLTLPAGDGYGAAYGIECTVVDNNSETAVFRAGVGVLNAATGTLVGFPNETTEFSSVFGWADRLNRYLGAETTVLEAETTVALITFPTGRSVAGKAATGSGPGVEIVATNDTALVADGAGALAFGQIKTAMITDGNITLPKLATQAALSVVTNATNGVASPTAVTAATDGHVFRRSGTALGFGTIVTAGIADASVTLAKMAANSIQTSNINDANVTLPKIATQAALSVVANATNSVASPTAVTVAIDGHVFRRSGSTLGFGTLDTAAFNDQTITLPKLTTQAALSVVANATNSTASPTAVAAAIDGHVFRRSGSTLGFGTLGTAAFNDQTITLPKLTTQAALTVVTNATNSTASPTAVAAATDGHVFRRSGTALGFGTIVTAGIADQTITLPKLANGSARGQSFIWDGSAWTLQGILTATNLTNADLSRSISDGSRFVLPNATLTAPRTLTLAATGSPILGETIYVERYDTTANIYTVVDAVSALTIFTFPVTIRRSASFRWNGTNWTNTESSIRLT